MAKNKRIKTIRDWVDVQPKRWSIDEEKLVELLDEELCEAAKSTLAQILDELFEEFSKH